MYTLIPNLMVYNLVIKLPVIAANICLAYLVADILKNLRAQAAVIRKAWLFMLLCPLVLYFGPAWGQFDSIVALLSLLSLVSLDRGKLFSSAITLALAIAFKPIALPLIPVAILYLLKKSSRQVFLYALWFSVSLALFCALPFLLWGWELTPILRGWNAHFTVAGGMALMTFFELLKDTYRLPGAGGSGLA
jgi:Gpi18-like mannosyltransferase